MTNPIVEEVVHAVFADLYGNLDPDGARATLAEKTNREILEGSALIESLGGVDLIKELAEALAEAPFAIIALGGPRVLPDAIKAGLATAVTAGAVLARRADAVNAELPQLD